MLLTKCVQMKKNSRTENVYSNDPNSNSNTCDSPLNPCHYSPTRSPSTHPLSNEQVKTIHIIFFSIFRMLKYNK
jgi:hypothetical protein